MISRRLALLSGLLVIGAASAAEEVPSAELSSILAPPLATPVSGAAQGDVTIVDYFDYNCPVCRDIEPTLRKLTARDPKVRLGDRWGHRPSREGISCGARSQSAGNPRAGNAWDAGGHRG